MHAVRATEGCELLVDWVCQERGTARAWYLVPSVAGGRLLRKQGRRVFLDALAPWALSRGIALGEARVVPMLPTSDDALRWPPLRPEFPHPRREGGSVRFAFFVPYGLAIFRGHFPAVPIVPGALLTGWVTELAREHCDWQHGASCVTVLKFRRIVQPGLTYELQIDAPAGSPTLDFHIRLEDATCALGSLTARPHGNR